MNTEKLDKIVDIVFQEIGEIEHGDSDKGKYQGYFGLLNENGEVIAFKLPDIFYITEYFPILHMLEKTLDEDSFKYLMNKVGDRLKDFYDKKEPVEYERPIFDRFAFTYIR